MKTTTTSVLALLIGANSLLLAVPLGTTFTFQGRLADGNQPANGSYDFRFTLYNVAENGAPVSLALTNSLVTLSNGLFTVPLDFGADVFTGEARWLEIGVRSNGTASFTTLNPRQSLMPAPYSLYAPSAGNAARLNGQSPTAYAPAAGSPAYVAKAGDTMTGTLNLPANGLAAGGSQLVLSGGNVGIGTNNPQSTLHVAGTVAAGVFAGSGAGLTGLSGAALADDSITSAKLADGAVSATQLNTPAGPATGQVLTYDGASLVWTSRDSAATISGLVSEGSNDVAFAQVFIPGLSILACVGQPVTGGRPYKLLSVPPGTHHVTARLVNGRNDSTQLVLVAGQTLTNINFHFPLFYRDADGDGFGNSLITTNIANPPPGWVTTPGDFNDGCATCYPGAPELCDGRDNDGDNLVDEGLPDADEDGIPDCRDNCPLVANLDQSDFDHDGIGDVCDPDADGDGWTVAQGDCCDMCPDISPGTDEICDNFIDDNCNGQIDEFPCW